LRPQVAAAAPKEKRYTYSMEKYFLCKRCGLVFSQAQIDAADGKCPACFADSDVLLPCDKDGKLLGGKQ
jgi:rubrerythrin